jgi:asparaginyl-tRNA synthetase
MENYKLPASFLRSVADEAKKLAVNCGSEKLVPPPYNPETYYKDLTSDKFFDALVLVRHYVKAASDTYFGEVIRARNTDLFMLTPSVSSPMGPGSDSEAIPIQFGDLHTYLVDSSQFGFEPLLFQNLDKVYCYLPSMRGEEPDARHLNQFYHCEAEIVGSLEDLTPIMEGYVRALADTLLAMDSLLSLMSRDYVRTKRALEEISKSSSFKQISFDDAFSTLQGSITGSAGAINNEFGRTINSAGEVALLKTETDVTPIWMYGFDRDTVPFYQKPYSTNPDKVINADLLFPPLLDGSFGGEILGSGQRQDNTQEMYASLERQNISADPYEWYIDLRAQPGYRVTSGFGLGVERFITWALGYDNIRDVALYPRLKNVRTIP